MCLATLLSLGTRLASLLGYEKFIGEDDFSADYIDEGKALMKRGVYIHVPVGDGKRFDRESDIWECRREGEERQTDIRVCVCERERVCVCVCMCMCARERKVQREKQRLTSHANLQKGE